MNEKRLSNIMSYMRLHQSAMVNDLCAEFNVSDMTIRRDLVQLEQRNQVVRFHGGATVCKENSAESFQIRLRDSPAEKEEIAQTAAEYLRILTTEQKPKVIFLSSGSTMYRFAQHISIPLSATLVTDNVHVAEVLGSNPSYTVISIGGQLLLPSLNVVGYTAESMIRSFPIDYAFISTSAIDQEGNIYMYNMLESSAFQAIIETAKNVVLLADHTKFDRTNVVHLCQLTRKFMVITDSQTPEAVLDRLRQRGISVISAC